MTLETVTFSGMTFVVQRWDRYSWMVSHHSAISKHWVGSVQCPTPCAPGYRATNWKYSITTPRWKHGTKKATGYDEALHMVLVKFCSENLVWC
ncbi:MAG: hypothetical protein ACRDBL_11255 [Rhabdaerophilum sp.]